MPREIGLFRATHRACTAASAMLPCSIVDAFAAEGGAFTGNPAAVVVLGAAAPGAWAPRSPCEGAHWPEDAYLLAVAKEFNLSETAYVAALPAADGADAAALPRFSHHVEP